MKELVVFGTGQFGIVWVEPELLHLVPREFDDAAFRRIETVVRQLSWEFVRPSSMKDHQFVAKGQIINVQFDRVAPYLQAVAKAWESVFEMLVGGTAMSHYHYRYPTRRIVVGSRRGRREMLCRVTRDTNCKIQNFWKRPPLIGSAELQNTIQ